MNKQQEQTIKDALNIAYDYVCREEIYANCVSTDDESNQALETIDKAWEILFQKEDNQQ